MKKTPLDISLSLYDVAIPVFASLREVFVPRDGSNPDVQELTFTQLRALFGISNGKDRVGTLAKSARVAQSAMSKVVDQLIRLGYAKREPDPADRRQIHLSITSKGQNLMNRLRRKAAQRYVPSIGALSHREQKQIIDGVARILEIIEKSKGVKHET